MTTGRSAPLTVPADRVPVIDRLGGALPALARERASEPAVVAGRETWSWADLASIADATASRFEVLGLSKGSRIGVVASDGPGFVATVHAAVRLGAVLVALSRRAAAAELAANVAAVGAPAVIFDDATESAVRGAASILGGTAPALIPIGQVVGSGSVAGGRDPARSDPTDPATIIFTSGSTGRARPAILTRANHVASADAWAAFLAPRRSDRWLACLPFNHVGGLSILHRSVLWGVPLQLADGFDPEAIWQAIARDGISHLSIVGSTLRRLVAAGDGRRPPPSLRAVLVGGESTPADAIDAAIDLGFPIVPTYGATETASGVAALPTADWPTHRGSSGRALAGAEIRIVREGTPSSAGEPGEVQVRGPMVFAGYLGDAVPPVDAGGWLSTGDDGLLDADGYLTVLGRRDRRIISGGENIDPLEIEAVLRSHPGIADALVVGRPDARWGTVPVAIVVSRPGRDVADAVLEAYCRERMAAFKVPVAFERADRLPRAESGKVLRSGG